LHHPGMVWTTLLVYLRGGGWQNRVSREHLRFSRLRLQKSAWRRHADGIDFC